LAQDPCALCNERYLGPAITGYHRWFSGSARSGFRQKMCVKCARIHYTEVRSMQVDTDNEDAVWPSECPSCKTPLEGDVEQTWTTWYRGKTKQNVCLVQCEHCANNTRTIMRMGAERLEDRPIQGVREGGAPLPNPAGFGDREALPW
jgi:sulfur relay (sulfurtransferase) complex TusBCD TusD component (DsrE family)